MLSIIILTACIGTKKDLTSEEFISIASKYGYKTFDETFDELGRNSVDTGGTVKIDFEELKNKFDNSFDVKNSENKTSLMNIDLTKQLSFISFVEFEDEKYASEVMNDWDWVKKKKELGQLPVNIKNGSSIADFEEILVGQAKRVIVTGTSSSNDVKKWKMFVIYSKVGNNVVQILHRAESKEDVDKLLDELGF